MGGLFHVVAAVVGLSALLAASATAFTVIRLLGAAYLVWLGVQTLRRANQAAPSMHIDDRGSRRALRQGVVVELLNPKTALSLLTFLPQFVQPENGSVTMQILVLGAVSVALNSGADLVVTVLAGRLNGMFERAPQWWRRQRIASGLVLIGLGGAAAASGSRA